MKSPISNPILLLLLSLPTLFHLPLAQLESNSIIVRAHCIFILVEILGKIRYLYKKKNLDLLGLDLDLLGLDWL